MPNYRFLDFELSESNFYLSREGRRIPLEPKALRVLTVLVSRAGSLVDKQELLQLAWPDTFVEENTLTRTVAVLRRQLGDTSRDSKLIETVPTRGYRFIAPVEIIEAPAIVPSLAPSEPTVMVAAAAFPDTNTSTTKRFKWLLFAGCVALLAVFCLWIRHRFFPTQEAIRSLAVLPLDDWSPGMKEDYFADGMTDELITELAHIPGLRVVSRTSAMQEKGIHKPLAQIARELNVDAVVEGSVVRSSDHVRITAQLIDTRSDKHLWAQSFEGPTNDILSLQDDVARQISLQTSAVLAPSSRTASAKHIDPEAHDAYLRGLYFIQRREAGLAVSYFQKAIELEPEYGAANAGLAEALATEMIFSGIHAADMMPSAVAAARRGIELDPSSGEAYTALGAIETVYAWDWIAAEQNLRKGIDLSPGSSDAETWYAVYLISVNRPEGAVTAMRRAVALDPLSFWANRLLGSTLFYSHHYDESLVALKRAMELAPDKAQYVVGWNSGNYEMQGRYSDAFEADIEEMAPEILPQDLKSFHSAFETGGWDGYQKARVKYLIPRSQNQCNSIAMSYVRLGNLNEAIRWFNRDIDNRCGTTVFDLSADPRLDRIRQDPRFHALLRRVKLSR